MKLERHKWLVIGLLLWLTCLTWLTTSCIPGNQAEPLPAPASVTLRWVTCEIQAQYLEVVADRFAATYPHIDLKREACNNYAYAYLASSPLPDVLELGANYQLAAAIRKNQVTDLTEMWLQAGLPEALPASLPKLSVHGGKQYYVPVAYDWEAIYYNKAVFAQYNLEPPQTWDEFLQICNTLLANDVTPLAIGGDGAYTGLLWLDYLSLRLYGADFRQDLVAGKVRYDDDRVRTVVETWRSLFEKGYFVENTSSLNDGAVLNLLIRGDQGMLSQQKAAMALTESYFVRPLPAPFQAELDFFRFPIMNSSIPIVEIVSSYGYVVPVGAAHVPEAIAFLAFMSSAEAQTLVAQASAAGSKTFTPVRTDLDPDVLTPELRRALALVQEADTVVPPFLFSLPPEVWAKIGFAYADFMKDSHDIEHFLQKMEVVRQEAVEKGLLDD
jgi:ABC-type glycerol-3-phosphate transport system substrate-binding protein